MGDGQFYPDQAKEKEKEPDTSATESIAGPPPKRSCHRKSAGRGADHLVANIRLWEHIGMTAPWGLRTLFMCLDIKTLAALRTAEIAFAIEDLIYTERLQYPEAKPWPRPVSARRAAK